MAVKVTFTLDEATVRRIAAAAERTHKPKSQIVREAVAQYQSDSDRLSEPERQRQLAILREFRAHKPTRTPEDVRRELDELRAVRRLPGRLHPVD